MVHHGYRYAFFDQDGTLLDSAACVVEATRCTFEEHGLGAVDEGVVRGFMGVPVEQSFPLMGWSHEGVDWTRVIASYRARYVALSPDRVRAFEGVRDLLDALRQRGVLSVVVTSKRRAIAEADCRNAGIRELLADVIGSDCVKRPKPEPDPVVLACTRHAVVDVSAVLVIGDAVVDIRMGRAAGVATCAALWGAHARELLMAEVPTHAAERPRELYPLFGLA